MTTTEQSPLKRLPSSLPARESLFLDGIGHAADVANFAYARLQRSLGEITSSSAPNARTTAPIYLDAWACVDAIDRFRSLLQQYPKSGLVSKSTLLESFQAETMPLRRLRNVADHVADRIDHLVAYKASAMGDISWIERRQADGSSQFYTWLIRPGFLGMELQLNLLVPQHGAAVETPIGYVHLHAGDETAHLSQAVASMRSTVAHIEDVLRERYAQMEDAYSPIGSHVIASALLAVPFTEHPVRPANRSSA